jgi:hypothetical protein
VSRSNLTRKKLSSSAAIADDDALSTSELVESQQLQMSLFAERTLAEITSPAYPGEQLVAGRNPCLAAERDRKRLALLAVTEKALPRITRDVARRGQKVLAAGELGLKVGRVIHRHKMANSSCCPREPTR